jgi:hypothetical protein
VLVVLQVVQVLEDKEMLLLGTPYLALMVAVVVMQLALVIQVVVQVVQVVEATESVALVLTRTKVVEQLIKATLVAVVA